MTDDRSVTICSLTIHMEWIDELAERGQLPLCQPGHPRGHRRLQVGRDLHAGQNIIGPYGRDHLPYDKVQYRTSGPPPSVRRAVGRFGVRNDRQPLHGASGVEPPPPLLGESLDQHFSGG